MDNNFNQQNFQNDQNAQNVQNNGMFSNAPGNFNANFNGNVNYGMGVVSEKQNILLGSIGALAGAVVGTILWIVIAAFTGYVFFLLGAGIAFLAMFLYYKLAKGMNVVGVIICVVLTCVAIYVGNRVGTVFAIANEWNYSYSAASTLFDLNMDYNDSFKMEYIRTMIMSYIVSIGYTVAVIVSRIKKRK